MVISLALNMYLIWLSEGTKQDMVCIYKVCLFEHIFNYKVGKVAVVLVCISKILSFTYTLSRRLLSLNNSLA